MTPLLPLDKTLKNKEIYELNAQQALRGYSFSHLVNVLYEYWRDYRFWHSIKRRILFPSWQSVLDTGCGLTSVLNVIRRDFPQLELTGVDPLMDEFRQFYGLDDSINWKRAYLENLELPDNEFGIVCCTNALDHVEDIEAALSEIKRVIRHGGMFLLTLDIFAKEKDRNEGHPYSFTKDALLAVLQRCGFKVVWSQLSRRKIGVMNYADLRIRQKMSRNGVFIRRSIHEQLRSYAKQILGRGALGELVLVAKNI
jgi:ubiquinone/menaquinone biosynthesis C-methylase UbiE